MKKTKLAINVAIVAIVVGSAFVAHWYVGPYQYPFGEEHRCDKGLFQALYNYAEQHGRRYPSGEATPEASLSLLGADYAGELHHRGVSVKAVYEVLKRGEPLGPDTCGWNYVEGLRLDSNRKLALFWDKEGLDENGKRLPRGGHYVSFVGDPYVYVPESEWASFLEGQQKLLAAEKVKTRKK